MPLFLPLTGIDQLDQQHLKVVRLIDQLIHMIEKTDHDKDLLDVLSQLFQFTSEHFSTEEGYLKMAAYPNTAAHIEQHREFENNLKGWVQHFLMDKLDATELHQKLLDWFNTHISGSDMDYVPFLEKSPIRR